VNTSLVHGIHAVSRRIEQAPRLCLELYCTDRHNPRLQRLIEQARAAGITLHFESRTELTARCGTDKHQGCALLTRETGKTADFAQCLESITADSLLLVLDGVQDPHNLGACLRTADACGVDAVIIPKDRAAGVNATVRKVAAGGAESVPLFEVTNIARSLAQLKQAGVWIYGTSEDAPESLYDFDFEGPVALVMGGEGDGMRRLTRESCDHLLSLPMRGAVESLNVSVATGVCLYEILRSRNTSPKFGSE
jgi:23S rRNA (guanosine2251-2'-O)-methyltransferase